MAASDDCVASGIIVGLCEAAQEANVSPVPSSSAAAGILAGLLAAAGGLELEFLHIATLAGGNTHSGQWEVWRGGREGVGGVSSLHLEYNGYNDVANLCSKQGAKKGTGFVLFSTAICGKKGISATADSIASVFSARKIIMKHSNHGPNT